MAEKKKVREKSDVEILAGLAARINEGRFTIAEIESILESVYTIHDATCNLFFNDGDI